MHAILRKENKFLRCSVSCHELCEIFVLVLPLLRGLCFRLVKCLNTIFKRLDLLYNSCDTLLDLCDRLFTICDAVFELLLLVWITLLGLERR